MATKRSWEGETLHGRRCCLVCGGAEGNHRPLSSDDALALWAMGVQKFRRARRTPTAGGARSRGFTPAATAPSSQRDSPGGSMTEIFKQKVLKKGSLVVTDTVCVQ